MTQDEFFGAIQNNLEKLAAWREELPAYNVRSPGCVSQMRILTQGDASAPPDVRCFDLLSEGGLCGGSPRRFRVFACYAAEATQDGYRNAKFKVRKWYQESGRADSSEQPYAGALVVGAASPWPAGMKPDANDMPLAQMAFRILAAPHPTPGRGMVISRDGDCASCVQVFRALVPETFDMVERRVRDCVKRSLLPDGGCVGGGFLTVRRIMDDLPMIPADVVVEVFRRLQAEGTHRIGSRSDGDLSDEDRVYVENRPPSWLRKMWTRLFLRRHI
jgi:hypothetical protein